MPRSLRGMIVAMSGVLAVSCVAPESPQASPEKGAPQARSLNGGCLSADPVRAAFRLNAGTDHITLNLDDYGVFLLEAKDPACAATVANALKSKIESTLRTPFTDAVTNSSQPYGRWLDGGLVSLIFAAALELGPRGALDSDLLASLLRVRDSFQFNRDIQAGGCGVAVNAGLGNSCMDDYAVGSAGYAWIAAFDAARGWSSDAATMANSARNLVHAAFGTWDSICIHDDHPDPAAVYPPRGVCNVKLDSTTVAERQRLNAGQAQAISFNHGFEDLGYGIGLLTSIASTANALAAAGQPFSLLDFEQEIARALLREAQLHTDPAGTAFNATGCYSTDGLSLTPTSRCADMNYAPRMFPVGSFLAAYAGAPPVSACPPSSSPPGVYGFNLFAADSDIVNAGLTWGRVAVYLHLGYFWSGAASACGISPPQLGAQVVKRPHTCMADPPVGPGNVNAYDAGIYDYYCAYYRYSSGTDYGYCSQAAAFAQAAHVTTAATGSCQATPDGSSGAYWAYEAGYFDYLCRYYEYLGYGSDYGSYCFSSSLYAAKGRCTGCDVCTPACTGHVCGTGDGCGGTCLQGSGCCTASCSGKSCGDFDGCTGTCQPGSGCTSAPLQNYPPKGWVDGYNTQHVWGWACDPDYPDQSNRVDFYTTAWQGLGSVGAFLSSSAAISSECRGGFAHYFDFWPPGGIASGTHIMAWSIDLPYATPGNDNRALGGQGSVGNGTEFIIP